MAQKSSFSIILVFVALTISGWFFIPYLSVRLQPSQQLPYLNISFTYSGASPEAISRQVVSVLEPAVNILQGIRKIESYAYRGRGSIQLELNRDIDIDYFRFELSSIIKQVYPKLPQNVSYPQIYISKEDDDQPRNLLSYSLSGEATAAQVQKYAQKHIITQLSGIDGIEKIDITGGNTEITQISYKPQVLQHFGLNSDDVGIAIQSYFQQTELGRFLDESTNSESFIKMQFKGKEADLWKIPIVEINGRIILLGDIADVRETEILPQMYRRINGENTVTLSIVATKYANSLTVAKQVKQKMSIIEKNLGFSYSVFLEYDATEKIEKELTKIYVRTLFTVLILLVFVFLIRFDWRYLVIIFLALLSNMSLAFAFYYLFDVEIQLYSLAGITISLGFAIDNSLVIFEHIRSHGNRKAFIAIFASTLTTIGALISIFFLEEKTRLLLLDFALVIIINLSVSLLVSLFFIPSLIEKMYENKQQKKFPSWYFTGIRFFEKWYSKLIKIQRKRVWISYLAFLLLFGLPVFLLPQSVIGKTWYHKVYNTTLGSDFYNNYLREYTNKALGGSLRLFNYYVFDNDFYSEKQDLKLYVRASAPYGTTLEQLNEVFMQMESFIGQFSEVEFYISNINSVRNASIEISFKKEFQGGIFPYQLKNMLSAFAMDFGALNWSIYGVGKAFYTGFGVSLPKYIVSIKGYNYQQLLSEAEKLKKFILIHPRVQEVLIVSPLSRNDGIESYTLDFDAQKSIKYHTNIVNMVNKLEEFADAKSYDFTIYHKNMYKAIMLKPNLKNDLDFWNMKNLYVGNDSLFWRLKELAQIDKIKLQTEIYRINQEFELYLKYDYVGSAKFGDKYLEKILKQAKSTLPLGYHAHKEKDKYWFYSWEKPKKPYVLILLIIAIIFFISTVLFESFKQAIVILFLVPVSFIGVFLTFYLFHLNFDMGGFASF
ncbi:MAG: efflux RND transporter permease subunit, partial [Bacteroidales bacterium]|nr:efflux RND transporter permease subunit [Bacteroidales bacterium]